jgi:hypothetical protein
MRMNSKAYKIQLLSKIKICFPSLSLIKVKKKKLKLLTKRLIVVLHKVLNDDE